MRDSDMIAIKKKLLMYLKVYMNMNKNMAKTDKRVEHTRICNTCLDLIVRQYWEFSDGICFIHLKA